MSLLGIRPRGVWGRGKRKPQTRVLFTDPVGLKQTCTPQEKGGQLERRAWRTSVGRKPGRGCPAHRCAHPGTLHSTPHARGPLQRTGVPVGGFPSASTRAGDFHRPATETRRRRRFPAGAASRLGLRTPSPLCSLAVPLSTLVETGSHHCCPWFRWMGQDLQIF